MSTETRRLYRSRSDRMIGGVCGGLGDFLGMDPTIVRLIVVMITFMWPFTPLIYLVLMVIVPEEPLGSENAPIPQAEPEPEAETQPHS